MDFTLEKFSGPLDLLLQLIEEQKLEITDVALAQVTDQYLVYLEKEEMQGIGQLVDFLVIASTLLLIKSRALLPALELSREEEEAVQDLKFQLEEYRRYREAMKSIRELALANTYIYMRSPWSDLNLGFFPPKKLGASDLELSLNTIIASLENFLKPLEERFIAKTISIEEKIREVMARIEKTARLQLVELSGGKKKADIILSFLAILFLFKEKIVHLDQTKRFGEILINRVSASENGSN